MKQGMPLAQRNTPRCPGVDTASDRPLQPRRAAQSHKGLILLRFSRTRDRRWGAAGGLRRRAIVAAAALWKQRRYSATIGAAAVGLHPRNAGRHVHEQPV